MLIEKEKRFRVCPQCGYDNNELSYSFCPNCGQALPLTAQLVTDLVQSSVEYAGFWRRFVAYFIDGIILNIIGLPLQLAASSAYYYGLGTAIGILYTVGFWVWRSQTPGKMALGVKIVDANGRPIALGRAILRYFGYLVSSLVLGLGFFWIAWDSRKQGWHDKIAGTYVIKR